MTSIDPIEDAATLNSRFAALDLAGRLSLAASLGGRTVFTTSLGIEDQVITAEIGTSDLVLRRISARAGTGTPVVKTAKVTIKRKKKG